MSSKRRKRVLNFPPSFLLWSFMQHQEVIKKYVVIVSGATATGKSDFACKLAEELNGEIINADIGSFYTPLTIGTAKPDWRKEKHPHHLFDILDTPENFTVVQFRARVIELLEQIWQRGHVPIIVGGSAFYIKSLFFKQHDIVGTETWVQQMEEQNISSLNLWTQLHEVDPDRAAKIHPQDSYRLIRALAIFKATGQKPSEFEQIFDPIAPFYFITCARDRKELYNKIDGRVQEMLKLGWLQEVERLVGTDWQTFLYKKKLIGYDDLLLHQQYPDRATMGEVVAIISQKTRNYAKRQIIFLNKLQRDVVSALQTTHSVGSVEEINLTLCDVGLYIKGLSHRILQTLS